MKFVKKLAEPVIITLKELMKNHHNHKARIRAHSILLSDSGYKMDQIADILFINQTDTISLWFNLWDSIGLIGLFDEKRSGRPEILSSDEKVEAIKSAKESPRNLRLSLADLYDKTKKMVSLDTLKRILKSANFSWRRARKSLKSKRNEVAFQKSKLEIEILKARHRAGEIDLRFFDESGFDLTPSVPYAWQEQGNTIVLPSSRSSRISVLGLMNIDSQLESYVFNCSITADIAAACIDEFANTITKPTYIILDNAPIHTALLFQDRMEEWESKNIFMKFIPPYSPELNLIEILWNFIKYKWLSLDAYKTLVDLNKNLDEVLKNVGSKHMITFA